MAAEERKLTDVQKLSAIRDCCIISKCDGADTATLEDQMEEIGRILGVTQGEVEAYQGDVSDEA